MQCKCLLLAVVATSCVQLFMAHAHEDSGDHHGWIFDSAYWLRDPDVRAWYENCPGDHDLAAAVDMDIRTRIVGGNLAEPNMFPFLAQLLFVRGVDQAIRCSGSLISRDYIISAAHCINRALYALAYFDTQNATNGYRIPRTDFIMHENYISNGDLDDIGLLRLAQPAPILANIQPIPLARRFMTQRFLEGNYVTSAGYGLTSDNATQSLPSSRLYYVDTTVMAQQPCACSFLPGLVRRRNHICSDGAGGRGACDGDSGGPLLYDYQNATFLVGVTAFGSAAGCEVGYPTVYMKVSAYLDWISRHTGLQVT